jgi:hypothetical protein
MASELSREGKLALLKSLSKELLPPQRTPDYVIYNVPNIELLQDRTQLLELGTHLAKLDVHSEMVYIADGYLVYHDVCELTDSEGEHRPVHPEAEAVRVALSGTPYRGVVVKHHILDDVAYFVEALSECEPWRNLNMHHDVMHYVIRAVAGQLVTVVKVTYSLDDSTDESSSDITSSDESE